ncbi:MAG: metallophosphoesterase family protein [Planctomycetota bacterium]|nr:metallophosphoesterase family protein [Planctomycetota bacterium]
MAGSRRIPRVQASEHRIGLISDTHGLVHPALAGLLKGVEEILHAGDVGCPEVIQDLEKVAPVTAVSGNVDVGVRGLSYPAFARRDLYGLRVLITHYVGTPGHPMPPVAEAIKAEHPRLVLSGHTHKPLVETRDGILYVNPGSCGPRRFKLPISCGILTLRVADGAASASAEVVLFDLETGRELIWTDS